ncbi:MAG: phosphoribosyl-ATP diphosphatase [Streptococcaceae bacterium]|jgi:phosphoribosyl-ATP pyrophosphohydrolase|nr:phosphoribosyl-ATP diphosphatase [Streptococcaceae bacterium]
MINEVYQEILERKKQPKDGSYTNYLFDKGLDKILKKVGEEATEVIIAAKNDNQELIAETGDLVYHLLVLLVEQGVSLADISDELAARVGKKSNVHDRKVIDEY